MRFGFIVLFVVCASIAHADTFRLEEHMAGEELKDNHVWVKGQLANGTDFCYQWTQEQCSKQGACKACRVKYLFAAAREARRLHWDSRKQLWRDANGKPYDTKSENEKHHVRIATITDRDRFKTWGIVPGIWVMSPSGKFYTSVEHQTGIFHHSSFLAGGLVEGAGLVVFEHGKITHIDNESGHYRPNRVAFNKLLDALHVTDPLIVEYAAASMDYHSPTKVRGEKASEIKTEVPTEGPENSAKDLEYKAYPGYTGYTSYRGYQSAQLNLPEPKNPAEKVQE